MEVLTDSFHVLALQLDVSCAQRCLWGGSVMTLLPTTCACIAMEAIEKEMALTGARGQAVKNVQPNPLLAPHVVIETGAPSTTSPIAPENQSIILITRHNQQKKLV